MYGGNYYGSYNGSNSLVILVKKISTFVYNIYNNVNKSLTFLYIIRQWVLVGKQFNYVYHLYNLVGTSFTFLYSIVVAITARVTYTEKVLGTSDYSTIDKGAADWIVEEQSASDWTTPDPADPQRS